MLTIYHNPRCRKSREALNLIKESGNEVAIVEYLKSPLSVEELKRLVEKLDIPVTNLLRKGESVFKEKYKGRDLDDDEWFIAMAENPILIERPIIEKDGKAVLGRPPQNVLDLID